MNKQRGMKWWGYMICVALVISAILAGLHLIQTYTAQSNAIGSLNTQNKFETTTDFKFDSTAVNLEKQENGTYSYRTTLDPVGNYNGTKNKYELIVNNYICSTNDVGAGYIRSYFTLSFYNINGNIDCTDTLIILIQFYTTKTDVTITATSKDVEVISYWQNYIADNGLDISLVYAKRS